MLSYVRNARLTIQQHGDVAVCELLRRLSAVPSADNSTPHTEGQVLRHIVEYVGKGIASDVSEVSGGEARKRQKRDVEEDQEDEIVSNCF